jgi:hypothetical protein
MDLNSARTHDALMLMFFEPITKPGIEGCKRKIDTHPQIHRFLSS